MKPGSETVVLVHGIWMRSAIMELLGWHLRRRGYRTEQVSYNFLQRAPAENAGRVLEAVRRAKTPVVHLVGHSLGGIVILHLLDQAYEQKTDLPEGKVVLIGSPVRGSEVARHVYSKRLLRPFLGRSIERGLLGDAPIRESLAGYGRPIGVITGVGKFGIGAMFYRATQPGDGAVMEHETRLTGEESRITMPYSHTTLVLSSRCAAQVARFLSDGRFQPDEAKQGSCDNEGQLKP